MDKYKNLNELIDTWLNEDGNYDEKIWPEIEIPPFTIHPLYKGVSMITRLVILIFLILTWSELKEVKKRLDYGQIVLLNNHIGK